MSNSALRFLHFLPQRRLWTAYPIPFLKTRASWPSSETSLVDIYTKNTAKRCQNAPRDVHVRYFTVSTTHNTSRCYTVLSGLPGNISGPFFLSSVTPLPFVSKWRTSPAETYTKRSAVSRDMLGATDRVLTIQPTAPAVMWLCSCRITHCHNHTDYALCTVHTQARLQR